MFLAWLYDKMPMIDPRLVAYSLNVEHGTIHAVEPMRTFHTVVETQIPKKIIRNMSSPYTISYQSCT
jgi:hypothetical protein